MLRYSHVDVCGICMTLINFDGFQTSLGVVIIRANVECVLLFGGFFASVHRQYSIRWLLLLIPLAARVNNT